MSVMLSCSYVISVESENPLLENILLFSALASVYSCIGLRILFHTIIRQYSLCGKDKLWCRRAVHI